MTGHWKQLVSSVAGMMAAMGIYAPWPACAQAIALWGGIVPIRLLLCTFEQSRAQVIHSS